MVWAGKRNLAALAVGVAVLAIAWSETLAHMAHLVWTVDIFSHGIWVPIVSAWLLWRDRALLRVAPVQFWWPGAVALMAFTGLWLLGGAAEAKIAQHFAFVGAIQCLILASMGRRFYKAGLFPFMFLFAYVPFGDQLVAPMQGFTAKIVIWALEVTGITHESDGVLIQLSSGLFEVAAACAGVKFLFSSIVTGILLCKLAFRSWLRRALMMLASIAVPILANAVRVYGTLLISEATDISFAKSVDHIVYGWGFLSVILLILIAVAYRYSDSEGDAEDTRQSESEKQRVDQATPLAVVPMTLGMLSIVLSAVWLPSGRAVGFDCTAVPFEPAQCHDCGIRLLPSVHEPFLSAPNSDRQATWQYRLNADTIYGATALFAPDRLGHRLAASTALKVQPGWTRLAGQQTTAPEVGAAVFQETVFYNNGKKILLWRTHYVDGRFYGSPLQAKLAIASMRLRGLPATGQILAIATEFPSTGEDARSILTRFFSSLAPEQFLFGDSVATQEQTLCAA